MSRWKNSKQHPLQFYKPVKDNEWADALVFDIYVYEAGWVVFLKGYTGAANFYIGSNTSSSGQISASSCVNLSPIYDLRDEEGKTVSPETHPDLFTDLPWHSDIDSHTFGAIKYFSKILTINKPPFFKVDWGDGEFLETKGEIVKNIIVNEKNFTAKGFSSVLLENRNFTFGHNYKEPGRYTIKIKTNMANFYFLPTYNNYYYADGVSNKGGRCNLLKIKQHHMIHHDSSLSKKSTLPNHRQDGPLSTKILSLQ